MAATNKAIQSIVETALQTLNNAYPQDMQKLDANPAQKSVIIQAMQKVAEEEMSQADTFSFLSKHEEKKDLFQLVSKKIAEHLPSDRIAKIAKGLEIPTYRLSFRQADGTGSYYVDFSKKSGEKFMDPIRLSSAEKLAQASGLQIASIVVEAVGLLLSIADITIPEEVMAKVAQDFATTIMESSAVKAAVNALKKAFGSGGSGTSKAEAIWNLIKELYEYKTHGKVLWQIIKALCSNMSWLDWLKTSAIIAALIAAAIATDGVALFAKIILALNSADDFIKKLTNLDQLEAIQKTL